MDRIDGIWAKKLQVIDTLDEMWSNKLNIMHKFHNQLYDFANLLWYLSLLWDFYSSSMLNCKHFPPHNELSFQLWIFPQLRNNSYFIIINLWQIILSLLNIYDIFTQLFNFILITYNNSVEKHMVKNTSIEMSLHFLHVSWFNSLEFQLM
jgi:hypothetical protein